MIDRERIAEFIDEYRVRRLWASESFLSCCFSFSLPDSFQMRHPGMISGA